jgi:hypothetical protein
LVTLNKLVICLPILFVALKNAKETKYMYCKEDADPLGDVEDLTKDYLITQLKESRRLLAIAE